MFSKSVELYFKNKEFDIDILYDLWAADTRKSKFGVNKIIYESVYV